MKMKKSAIYNEFHRIAAEVVGDNRKAQKYYVMQMCEQLGKVNHKNPFVMWCSRKRCLVYQSGMQEKPTPKSSKSGAYYLFRNNSQSAERVQF